MFSHQWALTHRSFPRILPDSSNYSPELFSILFKCDVRMNFISHMSSPRSFKFFSSLVQLFYSSYSGVSEQFLVVFIVVILRFWRPKKSFFSKSCPFSQSFVVLASRYPLDLFHLWVILFTHPEYVRSCFSISFHRRPSFLKNSSSSYFSYRYPIIPVLRSSVL